MATPPDPQELVDQLKVGGMIVSYGITPEAYAGAWELTGHHEDVSFPFRGTPVSASVSEYFDPDDHTDAIPIYEHESEKFYSPDDKELYHGEDEHPAPITEVPTSTTNPARPRTVAAGYRYSKAAKSGTLTVVFRDGTFYNYYGVINQVWQNFKRARSKGRFIITYFDTFARCTEMGRADVSSIDPQYRATLYRLARTGQIRRRGYTGKQKAGSKRGTFHKASTTYSKENKGGSTRNKGK
jgi:hypothetical protein